MIDLLIILMLSVPTLALGYVAIMFGYGWCVLGYLLMLCLLAYRAWYIDVYFKDGEYDDY